MEQEGTKELVSQSVTLLEEAQDWWHTGDSLVNRFPPFLGQAFQWCTELSLCDQLSHRTTTGAISDKSYKLFLEVLYQLNGQSVSSQCCFWTKFQTKIVFWGTASNFARNPLPITSGKNIMKSTKPTIIWVWIIRMESMHKPCNFWSVFMVTWSQN